ncbi:hypothetical protein BOX15_Mlig000697g4, partial [Macrostomum lignano]
PASTVSQPTGPTPTGPQPTGPSPTGPQPTGPASTGPQPTGPASTVPQPTGPASTGPQPSPIVTEPSTSLSTLSTTPPLSVVQTTEAGQCPLNYCQNGRPCFYIGSIRRCSCGSKFIGDRCQLKRNTVTARNRIVGVSFINDFNQIDSAASISFFAKFELYMRACLSMSSNRQFSSAFFQFVLVKLEPGSVVTTYRLDVGTNTSSSGMSASDIASDVDSGITAFASSVNASAFNFSAENTTATPYDFCATGEAGCSPYATCTPTGTSYNCTCRPGYLDSDTSNQGTVCTQQCDSTVSSCSGNGICKTVTGKNFTCDCFTGYTGNSCSVVQLSPAVLALVIVVPILFVIIVAVVTGMLCMNRRQKRLKKRVAKTIADNSSPQESVVVSTYGSRNDASLSQYRGRIPRAHLDQPEVNNAYAYTEPGSGSLQRPQPPMQQTSSFAYPFKRYSNMMFEGGNGDENFY